MICRFQICIPTYNNPGSITAVVEDCLEKTDLPVLVIDDGSDVPVTTLLKDNPRLTIHRLSSNLGKGQALQIGFQECLRGGFTHMISFDADGQHLASQIQKLTSTSQMNPFDLVIGSRKLAGDSVPEISKFGRKFSNFWVKFQTSSEVADSQSGLRVYPLFRVQNLNFWTHRFDFEIEVLIKLMWQGVRVRECDVDVYYPPQNERVSHFDKLWDNVRISLLNTLFVVMSLLKSHKNIPEVSVAIGVGVLIGCTPFFGFHTLIAAAVSFLFRLNFLFILLGTQISLPPFIPFIIATSIWLGTFLLPDYIEGWLSEAVHWLLGSLVLGSALGLLFGLTTAIIMIRYRTFKRKAWTGQARGGVFGNWFLKQVIGLGGLKAGYFCLYFIVPYFYIFAPKARRAMQKYWKQLAPNEGFWKRQWRVLAHFLSFGQMLMDRGYAMMGGIGAFRGHSEGWELIKEQASKGQGLILVTAHVGGWDLAARLLQGGKLSSEFYRVHYDADGVTLNNVNDSLSIAVNRNQNVILVLRELLTAGKSVGLMGDRPLGKHFELVSFLGKLAPIDVTAFKIAAACKVPVFFTFGFKAAGPLYNFIATSPRTYEFAPGINKDLQCREWAQEYAIVLEQQIKKYPNQWFNFFDFWSSVPVGALAQSADTDKNSQPIQTLQTRPAVELAPSFQSSAAKSHQTTNTLK